MAIIETCGRVREYRQGIADQSTAGNKPWNLGETRRCRLPALGSLLRARLWTLDADQAAGFEKQWSENHDRDGFNNGCWKRKGGDLSLYGSMLFQPLFCLFCLFRLSPSITSSVS
jgi:hypothetical protein